MYKRFIRLIGCFLLLALLCGATSAMAQDAVTTATKQKNDATSAATADSFNLTLANPLTELATFEELCAALPQLLLHNAPKGAAEVNYNSIEGEPLLAQINFTVDGHEYKYRAAAAATNKIADHQEDVVSGLYYHFDQDVDEEDVEEGDKLPFAIPTNFPPKFEMEYNQKTPEVALHWYEPQAKTQYCLFSDTAGMPDMTFLAVAEALLAGK
ncbi:MAG: hypothetical protein RR865_05485 [Clostridia bacterium]